MTRSFSAAFLALAVLTACNGAKADSEAATATALPDDVREVASVAEAPVTVQEPAVADAAGTSDAAHGSFTGTGEFRSPVTSNLSPRLPGRVETVYVDEGESVRRGQPLLKLETRYANLEVQQISAQVAQARSAMTEAENEFRRKKELFDKGSVPQATYDRAVSARDQARAGLAASAAALESAQTRTADAVVRSPFDGVVVQRSTAVGERLQEASVAFVIAQTAPLDLRFEMPERFLPMVRKGQIVRATVDAYPGVVFEGRVDVVGQTVNPSSRSFFVEAEFPNSDRRLRPGMFSQVTLDLR